MSSLQNDVQSAQRLAATLRRVQRQLKRLQNGGNSLRTDATSLPELQENDLELCRALIQAAQENPHIMRLVLPEHKSEPEMPSPARTLVEGSAPSPPSFKRKRGTCDDSDISGPPRAPKRVRDASPQPALRQPDTEQEAIATLEDLWQRTATALATFSWPGPVAFVDGWIEAGPLRDAVEEHEQQLALLMQEAQGILCGRSGRETREKRASVCELISGQTKQLYDWIDEAREGARRRLPTSSPPTSSTPTLSPPPSESLRGRSPILSATPSRGTLQADSQTVTDDGWSDDEDGGLEQEQQSEPESSDEEPLSAARGYRDLPAPSAKGQEERRRPPEGRRRTLPRQPDRSSSRPHTAVPGAAQINDGNSQNPRPATDTVRPTLRQPRPLAQEPIVPTIAAAQFLALLSIMSHPNAYAEVASPLQLGAEVCGDIPKDQPRSSLEDLTFNANAIAKHHAPVAWVNKLQLAVSEFSFAVGCEKLYAERLAVWKEAQHAKTTKKERRKKGDSRRSLWSKLWKELAENICHPKGSLISWHENGLRWAYVLHAGSVPAFLAISVLDLKTELSKLDVESLCLVCAALRDPSRVRDCPVVDNSILPALLEWGARFNIKMGEHTFGQDLEVDDALIVETFDVNLNILPTRCEEWASWSSSTQCTLFEPMPVDMERPTLTTAAEEAFLTISTGAPPLAQPNTPIYESEKQSKEGRKNEWSSYVVQRKKKSGTSLHRGRDDDRCIILL